MLNLGLLGAQTYRPPQSQDYCLLNIKEYEGGMILWKLQDDTGSGGQFHALTVLQNFTQITIMEVSSNTFSVALNNQISFSVSSVKWK